MIDNGHRLCPDCQTPIMSGHRASAAAFRKIREAAEDGRGIKPADRLLFLILLSSMRDGNVVQLPLMEISRRCCYGVRHVSRGLRSLTEMGLITREDRFGGRGNCATIIIL